MTEPVVKLPRRITFSSDLCRRRFGFLSEEYDEVLSHYPQDIDLSRLGDRTLPLRLLPGVNLVGFVREIALEASGFQLGGVSHYATTPLGMQCKLEEERGLLSYSVCYDVLEATLVSVRKEESQERPGSMRDIPIYRCKWRPVAVVIDMVPALPIERQHNTGGPRSQSK